MVRWQSPFPHQFGDIAIAQRQIQVPAHATKDDLSFIVSPVERVLGSYQHGPNSIGPAISQRNLYELPSRPSESLRVTDHGQRMHRERRMPIPAEPSTSQLFRTNSLIRGSEVLRWRKLVLKSGRPNPVVFQKRGEYHVCCPAKGKARDVMATRAVDQTGRTRILSGSIRNITPLKLEDESTGAAHQVRPA
jgi:hypothetical protein